MENNSHPVSRGVINLAMLLAILVMFIVSISPAVMAVSYGTAKQNLNISLTQNCINSTYSNLTKIIYPDKTFDTISNPTMTKAGNDYNYTYSNTSQIGIYYVYGNCDEDGAPTQWQYDFEITPSGSSFNTSNSMVLLVEIISIIIICILLFFLGISQKNMPVKIFFLGLCTVIFVALIGFILNIMNQTMGGFSLLISNYSMFYVLSIILLTTLGFCLMLWFVAYAFKAFKKQRGYED